MKPFGVDLPHTHLLLSLLYVTYVYAPPPCGHEDKSVLWIYAVVRQYFPGMENRARRPYPRDISDEEWALAAPYLTLMREDAPQREHSLREIFDALRWLLRKKESKLHLSVDTRGHLLALVVMPAHKQDRSQVAALTEQV